MCVRELTAMRVDGGGGGGSATDDGPENFKARVSVRACVSTINL